MQPFRRCDDRCGCRCSIAVFRAEDLLSGSKSDKISPLCHLLISSRVTSVFIGGETARAAINALAGGVGCAINQVLMCDEAWPLLLSGPFRHGDR
jgi:hypothetical protein